MIFVIFLVAAAIFYLAYVVKHKHSNDKNQSTDTPTNTDELQRRAEYFKKLAMEDSPLKLDFSDDKSQLSAMENDFYRLKERYKHDTEKYKQICLDWYEYCYAMYEIHTARELLDVDMSDQAYDNFDDRAKEYIIKSQEIEKRFAADLGKESHIAQVNKELEEKHKNFSLSKEFDKIKEKEKKVV